MKYSVKLNSERLACIEVQLAPEFTATTTQVRINLVCTGDSLSEHAVQCAAVLSKLKLVPKPEDAPSAAEFATEALNKWIEMLRTQKFGANDELVFETAYRYGNEYLTLDIEPIYEP